MERIVLSVEEAAAALGISAGTAYQLIRERRLPAVRLGAKRLVVPRIALEEYLAREAAQGLGASQEAHLS